MKPARILIAEDNKALKTVVNALYGYDLVIVSTVKEAQRSILEDGIDLFIMGIHFDDSRATELASLVRESPKHATTPILLVRVLPSSIAKFIRSTSNALKISGSITDFLEFDNPDDVEAKLREAVEALLPASKLCAAKS